MAVIHLDFAFKGESGTKSIKNHSFRTYLNGKIIDCYNRTLKAYLFRQLTSLQTFTCLRWRMCSNCGSLPK
ncbi:hypothetical protein SAMN05216167_1583 [Spirosoma endophyticum]|uniref:Uncharacterized protein n=1 Tax=Spirosoma endophyticum TaxID=662367 RepID=A0A1I2I5S1_9BACT|nr:hypothetical protein SAMN05216167_1583 [Spirosoma endophyticum]